VKAVSIRKAGSAISRTNQRDKHYRRAGEWAWRRTFERDEPGLFRPRRPPVRGPGGCLLPAFDARSRRARGLPGTWIDRAAFQRADEGFPLDDVVVNSHDASGTLTTLQVQVKRSIQFSPSDDVFKKVVGQIAEAIKDPAFWNAHNELAIATAPRRERSMVPIRTC
jgi:hypothetical protein